jgi:uncharacterized Rossmann fold enzyme
MRWELWGPRYEEICRRLRLDPSADLEAARVLNDLLPQPELEKLMEMIEDRECVVFGAGPSLEEFLSKFGKEVSWLKRVWIAADGATSAVMEYRVPDVIVTDLDGKVEDQLKAWSLGSWLVIHAHGDNLPQLRRVVPKIHCRVIGTTQVRPFGKLFNFGGFTDGDRSAFLAHALGAKAIYLVGMDWWGEIGKYSGRKDPARKRVKLQICGELLEWLGRLGANLINLANPSGLAVES